MAGASAVAEYGEVPVTEAEAARDAGAGAEVHAVLPCPRLCPIPWHCLILCPCLYPCLCPASAPASGTAAAEARATQLLSPGLLLPNGEVNGCQHLRGHPTPRTVFFTDHMPFLRFFIGNVFVHQCNFQSTSVIFGWCH